MEQRLIRKNLDIEGMSCSGCEARIEKALKKLEGVKEVKATFVKSKVLISYDDNAVGLRQLIQTIENLGYAVRIEAGDAANEKKQTAYIKEAAKGKRETVSIREAANSKTIGIGLILLALYVIINKTVGFNFIPEVSQSMGYGVLFVVGLLTSIHCVAMCGGINLSLCISYKADSSTLGKLSSFMPSLLYNSGRVISYTIIGGIVGALGSGISLSGAAKGTVALISGLFMVIMGLNMLNIFPWLRKFNPRMPKVFGRKLQDTKGKHGPFYIGLLNGLMPCGPLQAMQIYALGTGSFAAGALSMFMFSMGTVPLMFGFGAISSIISGKFTHKMMKVSAVLVIVLGLTMTNRGLALSGFSLPSMPFGISGDNQGSSSKDRGIAKVEDGVQLVTTRLSPGSYEPITVQRGIPVKWTIQAKKGDINGCNNEIIIPGLNKSKKLETGDNIIEFTPTETGTYTYSCWMGMIRSKITVVDDISYIGTAGSGQGAK